jgi:RNA polymerase sigma-70 factor (ECF subfamily)
VDPSNTAASFQSTMWALVLGARVDRSALEQLLRAYWSPVYAFIRRQGYGGHDASDLTQEFLTQVVIGRDLVGRADPQRGRFRAFLKQALRNFLIDQHRLGRVSKGAPGARGGPNRTVPDAPPEATTLDALPAAVDDGLAAGGAFDRAWAATIIENTLERLEESLVADGMEAHWAAFHANVVGPALRRTAPLPLAALVPVTGAVDEAQVSNMLQTVKRRFRRTLRDVVAETVADEGQVEQELAELKAHFAH